MPGPLALPTARLRRVLIAAAVVLVLVVLAVLRLALASHDPAKPKGTVSIATGMSAGVYRKYGTMLRPDIEQAMSGVKVRLDPSRGSVENLERVRTGKSDFTIATVDAVAKLPARDRAGLRAVARLYDDYIQLVVPAGSPIRSAADLRGRRVAIGQVGSGVNPVARLVMRAAGLDPDRDVRLRTEGIDAGPKLLREGKLDAFFWSGGLPTGAVAHLSEHFRIRLVPLGGLAEKVQRLTRMPDSASVYRPAVMPADAYPSAEPRGHPVSTIAVANLMVTRAGADPELVEEVTRTVIANRDQIGRVVHAAQLVDLRTAIFTAPLPLHEGARRYYSSLKP